MICEVCKKTDCTTHCTKCLATNCTRHCMICNTDNCTKHCFVCRTEGCTVHVHPSRTKQSHNYKVFEKEKIPFEGCYPDDKRNNAILAALKRKDDRIKELEETIAALSVSSIKNKRRRKKVEGVQTQPSFSNTIDVAPSST